MRKVINDWLQRYLSDPEAVLLLVILIIGFTIIISFGGILAPLLASIVIAYLLSTWIDLLVKLGMHRTPAFYTVYITSLGICIILLVFLMPLVWRQSLNFFNDLPNWIQQGKFQLSTLPTKYPQYFSEDQIKYFTQSVVENAQSWGKIIFSKSLSSIPGIIAWIVYLVLVPIMVFFILLDEEKIIQWMLGYLPHKRQALTKVWHKVNIQLGNYIRGKMTEVILVSIFTYIVFAIFGLKYSLLLAILVGLSAVIPYIGTMLVTIPVVLVAYVQFGLSTEFVYLIITYAVVQFIDGYVVVPLLFSEAVNLHPLAIIVAILFFGGIWGGWGVFFSIPLATLFQTVITAWPRGNLRVR